MLRTYANYIVVGDVMRMEKKHKWTKYGGIVFFEYLVSICALIISIINFFKEKTGVNFAVGECERLIGKISQKARIIIDYDADFPNIITRVIFQ